MNFLIVLVTTVITVFVAILIGYFLRKPIRKFVVFLTGLSKSQQKILIAIEIGVIIVVILIFRNI
ncbi:MAG: hypothetical protein ABSC49_01290 [Candidatus Microgenomates bacterium]|jgi:hypothetical protein